MVAPLLIRIFNQCMHTRSIPSDSSIDSIFLLHKKNELALLDDKRPITLLNAHYKIWQLQLAQ